MFCTCCKNVPIYNSGGWYDHASTVGTYIVGLTLHSHAHDGKQRTNYKTLIAFSSDQCQMGGKYYWPFPFPSLFRLGLGEGKKEGRERKKWRGKRTGQCKWRPDCFVHTFLSTAIDRGDNRRLRFTRCSPDTVTRRLPASLSPHQQQRIDFSLLAMPSPRTKLLLRHHVYGCIISIPDCVQLPAPVPCLLPVFFAHDARYGAPVSCCLLQVGLGRSHCALLNYIAQSNQSCTEEKYSHQLFLISKDFSHCSPILKTCLA